VLPLTYLLELLRHVFVDQDALSESAGAIAVVAIWGAIGIVLALRMFRWEPREGIAGS
jgi:ABC-type polysaccharide/polyol phosphate export permease